MICHIVLILILSSNYGCKLIKYTNSILSSLSSITRGGKICPTRWASPVRPELRPGLAIKLLARKNSGPIWPDPIRPVRIFFAFKRLFGPISSVFRTGWAVKILVRKIGPIFARPGRLPALSITIPNSSCL